MEILELFELIRERSIDLAKCNLIFKWSHRRGTYHFYKLIKLMSKYVDVAEFYLSNEFVRLRNLNYPYHYICLTIHKTQTDEWEFDCGESHFRVGCYLRDLSSVLRCNKGGRKGNKELKMELNSGGLIEGIRVTKSVEQKRHKIEKFLYGIMDEDVGGGYIIKENERFKLSLNKIHNDLNKDILFAKRDCSVSFSLSIDAINGIKENFKKGERMKIVGNEGGILFMNEKTNIEIFYKKELLEKFVFNKKDEVQIYDDFILFLSDLSPITKKDDRIIFHIADSILSVVFEGSLGSYDYKDYKLQFWFFSDESPFLDKSYLIKEYED